MTNKFKHHFVKLSVIYNFCEVSVQEFLDFRRKSIRIFKCIKPKISCEGEVESTKVKKDKIMVRSSVS
jgi:hypothetical protein